MPQPCHQAEWVVYDWPQQLLYMLSNWNIHLADQTLAKARLSSQRILMDSRWLINVPYNYYVWYWLNLDKLSANVRHQWTGSFKHKQQEPIHLYSVNRRMFLVVMLLVKFVNASYINFSFWWWFEYKWYGLSCLTVWTSCYGQLCLSAMIQSEKYIYTSWLL